LRRHRFSPSSTNEVVVGMHNIRNPDEYTERVRVTQIIPNAKYGRPPRDSSNDIMLLKLERPLTFNDGVSPVCLPPQFKPVAPGTRCFSTGWGALHCELGYITSTGSSYCVFKCEVYQLSKKKLLLLILLLLLLRLLLLHPFNSLFPGQPGKPSPER